MQISKLSWYIISAALLVGCGGEKKEEAQENEDTTGYEVIFLDLQDTTFNASMDANLLQETKTFKNLDLKKVEDFWGEKNNFCMRGLGTLSIPEDGEYFFKLTTSGKANIQLNNVNLVGDKNYHELIASSEGSRNLKAGLAVFDFIYYPGQADPFLTLEWSRNGQSYEMIPNEHFGGVEDVRVEAWNDSTSADGLPANTLTDEEVAEGWQLLFDGESTNGWHTYNNPGTIGRKWQAVDGNLFFEGYEPYFTHFISGVRYSYSARNKKEEGGLDIVTDKAFVDFELKLEWKVSKDGNSGIFYTVQEIPEYNEGWKSSPEMQILDNQGQKDGLIRSHRAGDLYDLIPGNTIRTKAHGEWNQVRIVKNKGKVEHWMNGEKVIEYDLNSPEWTGMIENSKFAQYIDNYGLAGPGKIGLQDHDDPIWFRNIKIKEL